MQLHVDELNELVMGYNFEEKADSVAMIYCVLIWGCFNLRLFFLIACPQCWKDIKEKWHKGYIEKFYTFLIWRCYENIYKQGLENFWERFKNFKMT